MKKNLAVGSLLFGVISQVALTQESRASGDVALAAFQAPMVVSHNARVERERAPSWCKIHRFKCVIGSATLGFVGGALVGNLFVPNEVTHDEYSCSIFFGCGNTTRCDAHCDEPVTIIWALGLGGGVLGGLGGYHFSKPRTP
ncbi:MAG TPA: hypothetical protein VM099_09705 [Gemmatimonadaceae bacterium]|nr:hypothetical protein [Gemmatimonadaceae bacterium]